MVAAELITNNKVSCSGKHMKLWGVKFTWFERHPGDFVVSGAPPLLLPAAEPSAAEQGGQTVSVSYASALLQPGGGITNHS